MDVTPEQIRAARALLRLEQAEAEFIPDGVRHRSPARLHPSVLYEDLREISLRSAARLQGHELLTEADLYDQDGLPGDRRRQFGVHHHPTP